MSREQIKEEFLKSYNCSSMKEFKHTKLTSEKFYEIMEDYFTKCSYNQKYKEVIDKATEYINENSWYYNDEDSGAMFCLEEEKAETFCNDLLEILKEVE